MKHKKLKHREKVAACQNYNANGCPFEESKCWFIHMQNNEDFKCNLCQENFISKSNFMKHRIRKHRDLVQFCRNNEDCEYKGSCWFRHEIHDKQVTKKISEDNKNVNNKILENIEKINDKNNKV